MGKVIIQPYTTENPIQMIGYEAGVCWGADISDKEKNYKRGLDCIKSNHGRTLEFPDVYMTLTGYSARVLREYYTHIGGAPTRLQESTRYIDYNDFGYVTPPSIEKNEADRQIYVNTMNDISIALKRLETLGVPREDSAMLLPLGMKSRMVDKRNLRNLIDMSRQRMCNRAYWEFRGLFDDILKALSDYSEEWKYLVDTQMMPKCEYLGYCPEKHSCGRVKQKE